MRDNLIKTDFLLQQVRYPGHARAEGVLSLTNRILYLRKLLR